MEKIKRDIEEYRNRPDNMKSQFVIFVLDNTTIEEYYNFKKELGGGFINNVGTVHTPLLQFAEKYFNIALDRYNKLSKQEYLLCAAIRRVEPRDCPKVYWEQFHDIYKIEIGWRHPDILHRFGKEVSRNPKDQGFYTSKGRFVTRDEGLEIARASGQVKDIIGGVLTSEDLY